MDQIKQVGIPLLAHINIYKKNKGHHFGVTFLWIFTLDMGVERKHIDLTLGIGNLYAQLGMGVV